MGRLVTAISIGMAVCIASSVLLTAAPSLAQSQSNDGQYVDLIRSYECRRDRKQYGSFHNYGYWKGGRWCGHNMPGGCYVYQSGVWYIWAAVSGPNSQQGVSDLSDAAAQAEER